MKKFVLPLLLLFLITNTLAAQEVILKNGKYLLRETGKPYSGIFKEYNPDNKLISATGIKDGILDGPTTIYYPSGAKKEIRVYQDGQKSGTWSNWNEAGKKIAEAGFKNGKKDGFWLVWDDRGVKRYDMFYVNGEKKGLWIICDEKGNEISREEFK
jgi:antitoxin component YwqK of YwqJK toxin-antitoxin module